MYIGLRDSRYAPVVTRLATRWCGTMVVRCLITPNTPPLVTSYLHLAGFSVGLPGRTPKPNCLWWEGAAMRVVVNLTRCQAYAQCAFLAPDVFRMRGAEALMYDPEPDDAQRERVLRAAAACPVQAILVDRADDREAAVESATTGPAVSARTAASSRTAGWRQTGEQPSPDGHDAATEAFRRDGRIVIVGASLAGLAAAATLRGDGFTGSLTMIGDEPYQPYDRPPLSKQVLEGWVAPDHTACPASTNSACGGCSARRPPGWTRPAGRYTSATAASSTTTDC
ncbi:hypothetical protein GCM10027610_040440 [Dactylosporangium cerinum]